jgi:hypothetical protein
MRSQLNLKIGGGDIIVRRGRPQPVSEVILCRHLAELISLEDSGLVEVFNARSQRIDLRALSERKAPVPEVVSEGDSLCSAQDDGDLCNERLESPLLDVELDAPPIIEDVEVLTDGVEEVGDAEEGDAAEEGSSVEGSAPVQSTGHRGKRKHRR